jgi:hypothetical protein
MERCKPRWVFSIYTRDRHRNSNTRTTTKTPTRLGFATSVAAPPILLHLRSGEQISRTIVLRDLAPGEGE